MASDGVAPVTYQEVLDNIAAWAEKHKSTFRLKVARRPNAASPIGQHVGTFSDATWNMIADAETWLQAICGGGLYVVQVYDTASSKHVGTIQLNEIAGPVKPIDPRITKSSSWIGPTLIEAPGAVGAGAIPLSTFQAPESYGPMPPPRSSADPTGLGSLFSSKMEELRQRELEIREQAHKSELEALKRASDDRAKQLQDQLVEVRTLIRDLAAKPPPPPPPAPPSIDIQGLVIGVITAAAPIVSAVLTSQKEAREVLARAEANRLERETAARKAELELEEKRLEREASRADSAAKRSEEQVRQFADVQRMMAEANKSNMEANAAATRQMFQNITTLAELSSKLGGESESGFNWKELIAGVVQGFAAIKGGGMAGVGGTPQQLGGTPQLSPQLQPAQAPMEIEGAPQLDAVEDKIRAKKPPDEIAADLKSCLDAPEVKNELQAMGGWQNLFDDRLGEWAKDKGNEPYIAALIPKLVEIGIFPQGAA